MGKACPFAMQNLIKIEIFKFMALCDTLVYDSDNWSTYYVWFALSSGVFCFCVWPSFIGDVLSVIKVYEKLKEISQKLFLFKRIYIWWLIFWAKENKCFSG